MHFRKLMALRGSGSARYVSKNNANIARIPLIARLFPDAIILVPFRNPMDHAGSLLRTHLLFHPSALRSAKRANDTDAEYSTPRCQAAGLQSSYFR